MTTEQTLTQTSQIWITGKNTPVITIQKNIVEILQLTKDDYIEVTIKKLNKTEKHENTESE